MNTIDRHLCKFFVGTTLAVILATIGLLMFNRLIKLLPWLLELDIALSDIGMALLYLVPSFLVFALPIACWIGWMIQFGRLGANSELTAVASIGQSPLRTLRLPILISILLTLLGLGLSQWGYGQGRLAFQEASNAILKKAALGALKPGRVLALDDNLHIGMSEPDKGESPVFFIAKEPDTVLFAQQIEPLETQMGLALEQGFIIPRESSTETIASFAKAQIVFPNLNLDEAKPGSREQKLDELWQNQHKRQHAAELFGRLVLALSSSLTPIWAYLLATRRSRHHRSRAMLLSTIGIVCFYGVFTFLRQLVYKQDLPWIETTVGLYSLLLVAGIIWFRQRFYRPGLP